MPLPFSRGFAERMALTSWADAWMDKLTSRFSLENAAFPRRGLSAFARSLVTASTRRGGGGGGPLVVQRASREPPPPYSGMYLPAVRQCGHAQAASFTHLLSSPFSAISVHTYMRRPVPSPSRPFRVKRKQDAAADDQKVAASSSSCSYR